MLPWQLTILLKYFMKQNSNHATKVTNKYNDVNDFHGMHVEHSKNKGHLIPSAFGDMLDALHALEMS